MKLNENMFDDVIEIEQEIPDVEISPVTVDEIKPEGPDTGVDTGVANYLMDLIKKEYDLIQEYNYAVSTAEEYGFTDFVETFRNIANQEMLHVGSLEALLGNVSPNTENIEIGKADVELFDDDNIEGIESYLLDESTSVELGPLKFQTNTVDNLVNRVGDTVDNTVDDVTSTVDNTVDDVTSTVDNAVDDVMENPEGAAHLASAILPYVV